MYGKRFPANVYYGECGHGVSCSKWTMYSGDMAIKNQLWRGYSCMESKEMSSDKEGAYYQDFKALGAFNQEMIQDLKEREEELSWRADRWS